MRLRRLQENWNRMGAMDPLWAVATAERYRGGKWRPEEFFATGVEQVRSLMDTARGLGFVPSGRALDFGCGVGRLTAALAAYFHEVIGVDIAPSMLDKAREFDTNNRCKFVLNERPDLSLFDDATFRLVYSEITLMHMRTNYTESYISEFMRVCEPGGLVVFQLPSVTPKQRLRARIPGLVWDAVTALRTALHPRMEIYGMEPAEVHSIVTRAKGTVVLTEVIERNKNFDADNWRYYAMPGDPS